MKGTCPSDRWRKEKAASERKQNKRVEQGVDSPKDRNNTRTAIRAELP